MINEYNNNQYINNLPNERGNEYTVIVRQIEDRDENGLGNGTILLQFSFFENNNICEIQESEFWLLTDELKGR